MSAEVPLPQTGPETGLAEIKRTFLDSTESKESVNVDGLGVIDIYRPKIGQEIDCSTIAAEHHQRRTCFNMAFYDFGLSLDRYRSSIVAPKERIIENSDQIYIHAFDNPDEIDPYIDIVSEIAQKQRTGDLTKRERLIFRTGLERISLSVHTPDEWRNADANIVPLRGGALIADLLPVQHIIPIDSKRVPLLPEGRIGLGMHFPGSDEINYHTLSLWMEDRIQRLHGKRVRLLEAAVATGITTIAQLFELKHRNVEPESIEVVAPVAAQQGCELVLAAARSLGFNLSIRSGKMFYCLGDFWKGGEDSILNDNGAYVIGRATDIMAPFLKMKRYTPKELNGLQIN